MIAQCLSKPQTSLGSKPSEFEHKKTNEDCGEFNNEESSSEDEVDYKNYINNEKQHSVKWTLERLRDHFMDNNQNFEKLYDEICDIVAKTLIGVEGTFCDPVNRLASHRLNCFELFGFDILVDNKLKPWL